MKSKQDSLTKMVALSNRLLEIIEEMKERKAKLLSK